MAAITAAYQTATAEHSPQYSAAAVAVGKATNATIFGQLKNVKLKKTHTVERTMFMKTEGGIVANAREGENERNRRTALSKLLEFPGDMEEFNRHLANPEEVNPAGCDAFGLTALHKLASWNKVTMMELLLPLLPDDMLDERCPDGKTPLHWAVEMHAVQAVELLLRAGADRDIQDGKGCTVACMLDQMGASDASGVVERLRTALLRTHPEVGPV